MQNIYNPIANALEVRLFRIKPLVLDIWVKIPEWVNLREMWSCLLYNAGYSCVFYRWQPFHCKRDHVILNLHCFFQHQYIKDTSIRKTSEISHETENNLFIHIVGVGSINTPYVTSRCTKYKHFLNSQLVLYNWQCVVEHTKSLRNMPKIWQTWARVYTGTILDIHWDSNYPGIFWCQTICNQGAD